MYVLVITTSYVSFYTHTHTHTHAHTCTHTHTHIHTYVSFYAYPYTDHERFKHIYTHPRTLNSLPLDIVINKNIVPQLITHDVIDK